MDLSVEMCGRRVSPMVSVREEKRMSATCATVRKEERERGRASGGSWERIGWGRVCLAVLLFIALTALQQEREQSWPFAGRHAPLSDCGDHVSGCAAHKGAANSPRVTSEATTDLRVARIR